MITQEEASLMHDKRMKSLREAEEAMDAGMASVEGLAQQEKQLKSSEESLHQQQYLVAKSRRMVRGMTWSGWVANMFSDEPPPPPTHSSTIPESNNYKVALHHQKYQEYENNGSGNMMNIENSKDNTVKSQLKAQDEFLNEQLKNMDKLGTFSNIISDNLKTQNKAIDVIDDHVEEVNDETRSVIRMQGRLHSSVRGKPIYLYNIILEHIDSGRLLYINENNHADLLPYQSSNILNQNHDQIPLIAKWQVYQRPNEVCAFRNCSTYKYLGQNMLGYIKGRGSDFGNWESFEYDLVKNDSPLLCCSANSNGGGWIHVLPMSDKGESNDKNNDKSNLQGHCKIKLEAKSFSLEDKKSAPKWHFHRIDGPDFRISLKYDLFR
mmetsp:Transcript_2876/g.3975  ORF Transcript_2876/g.3975 Transcript_2876/m.3975 type:complete len:379 (-) Transcript_2876:115-1251(-)